MYEPEVSLNIGVYNGKQAIESNDALGLFGFFEENENEDPAVKAVFATIKQQVKKGEFYDACQELKTRFHEATQLNPVESNQANQYYRRIIKTLAKIIEMLNSNDTSHLADNDVLDDVRKEIFDTAAMIRKDVANMLTPQNKRLLGNVLEEAYNQLPSYLQYSHRQACIK